MAANQSEQAVAYAALILADESIAITPEKLQTLLKAAGHEDIEPIWTTLFASALKGKNVKDILTTVTTSEVGRGSADGAKHDDGGVKIDDKVDSLDTNDNEDSDEDFGMSLFE